MESLTLNKVFLKTKKVGGDNGDSSLLLHCRGQLRMGGCRGHLQAVNRHTSRFGGAVKHVGLLVHLFLTRMLDICQSSSVVQKSCSVNGILT